MNSLEKVFVIMLGILILYIFPSLFAYENLDDISYNLVYSETVKFLDQVRNKGYITPHMYNNYLTNINNTGNVYEINLIHYHACFDPLYQDPSDQSSFEDDVAISYDNYYSEQILQVLYPNNNLPEEDDSRIYRMSIGDFISIEVKNINKTNATLINELLTNGLYDATKIQINYGGLIRNETG